MRPEIDAYLREHGDMYNSDALRRQLLAAGHDPAEVDAALREREAARTRPRSGSGLGDTAWALYIIGAVIGAGGALLIVGLGSMVSGGSNPPVFLALYAVAYLGLGYIIARLVSWFAEEFEIRGVGAVLIGLVLVPVFGGLMFGTCVAAANLAARAG